MPSDRRKKTFGRTQWDLLEDWYNYKKVLAFIPLAFLLMWLIIHSLALENSQVCIGPFCYTKGTSEDLVGYVPRSAIVSEDGRDIFQGATVTVREGGTFLYLSPSLHATGPSLGEETRANVISLEGSWVKIKLNN